jgi:hypothetical protein
MKYFYKTLSIFIALAAITSCNSYRDKALLACNHPNFLNNYDQYKTNRDKSIALFTKLEPGFTFCDQKYLNAFHEAEQRTFAAALDRANRALVICRDDMAREVDHNKLWLEKIIAEEMIANYDKYKKLYPATPNFDIGAINKCSNYYKNFDETQERKTITSKYKEKVLLKKYRYKYIWDEKGLSGLIQAIDSGEISLTKAKQHIVKKDTLLFDSDLIVDEASGALVIYKNIYNMELKIALQRNRNELYAKDSNLNGSYFVVVGTKKFKINDKITDILVFKKIL